MTGPLGVDFLAQEVEALGGGCDGCSSIGLP